MNREWSEKNRDIQQKLKKSTLEEGKDCLLDLRESLMTEMLSWKKKLKPADFSAIPFINAKGYHSKTVAYSLWHIFRIEDIVVNTLIQKKEEVFFSGDYKSRINSSVITTGNELVGEQIAEFSSQLDTDRLYDYGIAVKSETEGWLKGISSDDLKTRFDNADRERIRSLAVVSESEQWLIDYWCGKDVKGLILMPMSRHWIMHTEAAMRIIDRICKQK